MKIVWVMIVGVVAAASDQQAGKDHETRVAFTRYKEAPRNSVQNKEQRQEDHQRWRHLNSRRYRRKAWRQGDRMTKEEIIQNLAQVLLARKQNPDEISSDRKLENERKLNEYILYEAALAKRNLSDRKRREPSRREIPIKKILILKQFRPRRANMKEVFRNE